MQKEQISEKEKKKKERKKDASPSLTFRESKATINTNHLLKEFNKQIIQHENYKTN